MSDTQHDFESAEATAHSAGKAHTAGASLGGLPSATRRRALLKGLGKAGALAGAAVPLRSLAGGDKPGMRLNKNGKDYLCTMSGQQSAVHSANTMSISCRGNTCTAYQAKDRYGNRTNWPKNSSNKAVCIVDGTYYLDTAKFFNVFGSGSTTYGIGALVDQASSANPSDEVCWVIAMLNATTMTNTFPYSTREVRALYQNAGQRTAACTMFRTYLQV